LRRFFRWIGLYVAAKLTLFIVGYAIGFAIGAGAEVYSHLTTGRDADLHASGMQQYLEVFDTTYGFATWFVAIWFATVYSRPGTRFSWRDVLRRANQP
jgi:hypothetical protein